MSCVINTIGLIFLAELNDHLNVMRCFLGLALGLYRGFACDAPFKGCAHGGFVQVMLLAAIPTRRT
ncbi:MAG: hypothetical protein JWR87_2925 [Segetibacter sp.]|jgi:hypothetical protein|nr:hypothetical protein [Segetibacter sp.]